MEGYYQSTVSYFAGCGFTSASVHYLTNAKSDYSGDAAPGQITQMIRDSNYAWHVVCWNTYCTGTEHEGFASNPAWYTDAQYQASAGITANLANKFGYAKDRNHIIGHGEKSTSGWPSYASANFGIDPYCNTHTDPGPYWDWSKYMGMVGSGGAVPARIDVFQRGLDNACWHKSNQDGVGWSGWSSMGGSMASDPASVSGKYSSINVVARVGDNSIWHISWDGSVWSSWTALGGSLIGSPDVSSKDQNNVEIFARGADSAMWHKWWNGSVWSSWATLGGSLASDPGASSRGNGLVDVYARVADNSMWHKSFFSGGWGGWTSMGGSVIGGPDAASKNINQEEIFVRG
ncbi:MAG: N-acetylmuramoyl-L-alanine amidase, partial [Limisphaerales bacterium]